MRAEAKGLSVATESKIKTFVPDGTTRLLQDLVAQRPIAPAGPRLSKGEKAKRKILDAAFDLFISVRMEDFTLRKLAAEVGIELGNLTYHFASKSDLVENMVRDRMAAYAQEILSLLQVLEGSPRDALEKTIVLLVQDLRQQEIAFFPKLWALSLHDPKVAMWTAEIHETERQLIAGLIHATRPDWDQHACEALALHVTASIEGLTLFIGQDRRKTGIYKAPEQEIIGILRKIL
jgi:AcrR family transcriptional regulator